MSDDRWSQSWRMTNHLGVLLGNGLLFTSIIAAGISKVIPASSHISRSHLKTVKISLTTNPLKQIPLKAFFGCQHSNA